MKFQSEFERFVSPGLDCEAPDPVTGEIPVCHVKQASKEECDINNIMRRYESTGQLPEMIAREPRYGDFSAVPDFLSAMDVVAKAQEQFDALPAVVRDRFSHDPAKMLEFCSKPENREEMVKLGLALPKTPAIEPGSAQPPLKPEAAPAAPAKA